MRLLPLYFSTILSNTLRGKNL